MLPRTNCSVLFRKVTKCDQAFREVNTWNAKKGKETDTAVLRYDRVAMREAVLSIRERQQKFVRWMIVAMLLLAGCVAIAAGILGWSS